MKILFALCCSNCGTWPDDSSLENVNFMINENKTYVVCRWCGNRYPVFSSSEAKKAYLELKKLDKGN